MVLGKYTDERTALGTAAEIGLAFTPLDVAQDLRDLSYDLSHLKTTPWHQTALDALALIPVLGAVKPIAKAIKGGTDAAKTANRAVNAAESLADAAKHGDDLVDAGGELVYNGARQFSDIELKPADLMEELATSGKKYTPEDVLMVTKNSSGDLLWLEKGHEGKDGFVHILEDHATNFEDQGYTTEEIPELLKSVLASDPIKVTSKNGGLEAVYDYNGHNYTVGYGTNGYVVSFYPSKGKKR